MKKRKTDLQDIGHFGFLIGTILAFFLSASQLDAYYQIIGVSWPFGSGEEAKNTFSRWLLSWISDPNEEINTIRINKMHSILVRSRAKIIKDYEKPDNFFCNLEKHNFTSKIIPKLEKNDGKITTDQVILIETKQFYDGLYARKDSQLSNIDLNNLFDTVEIRKLSKNEPDSIEGPITYDEKKCKRKPYNSYGNVQ